MLVETPSHLSLLRTCSRWMGALITSAALALAACTPTPAVVEESVSPPPPKLSLRAGPLVVNPTPLPRYTPIYIDKLFADGTTASELGFHAWDFNADGRFDLVEVLDAQGGTVRRLFDFDFDGLVDLQK